MVKHKHKSMIEFIVSPKNKMLLTSFSTTTTTTTTTKTKTKSYFVRLRKERGGK